MYDVPGRSSDNLEMFDASDEVYEYLVCSICPVSLSKAGIKYYNAESNCIQDRYPDVGGRYAGQGIFVSGF